MTGLFDTRFGPLLELLRGMSGLTPGDISALNTPGTQDLVVPTLRGLIEPTTDWDDPFTRWFGPAWQPLDINRSGSVQLRTIPDGNIEVRTARQCNRSHRHTDDCHYNTPRTFMPGDNWQVVTQIVRIIVTDAVDGSQRQVQIQWRRPDGNQPSDELSWGEPFEARRKPAPTERSCVYFPGADHHWQIVVDGVEMQDGVFSFGFGLLIRRATQLYPHREWNTPRLFTDSQGAWIDIAPGVQARTYTVPGATYHRWEFRCRADYRFAMAVEPVWGKYEHGYHNTVVRDGVTYKRHIVNNTYNCGTTLQGFTVCANPHHGYNCRNCVKYPEVNEMEFTLEDPTLKLRISSQGGGFTFWRGTFEAPVPITKWQSPQSMAVGNVWMYLTSNVRIRSCGRENRNLIEMEQLSPNQGWQHSYIRFVPGVAYELAPGIRGTFQATEINQDHIQASIQLADAPEPEVDAEGWTVEPMLIELEVNRYAIVPSLCIRFKSDGAEMRSPLISTWQERRGYVGRPMADPNSGSWGTSTNLQFFFRRTIEIGDLRFTISDKFARTIEIRQRIKK